MPRISPVMKQCFSTFGVVFNMIGHGAGAGFTGILLPQVKQAGSGYNLTTVQESWLASSVGTSIFIGSFTIAPLVGTMSRKTAHYIISVIAIIGWVVTTMASSFWVLILSRIIIGVSFVMMVPLRSVLIGEYSSPKIRGAFLATISLSQGFGIFFVHFVGTFLNWQRTALVCMFLPFCGLIVALFTPESPSWLASKGRYDECREAFRWLRGMGEEDELEKLIRMRMALANRKKINMFQVIRKREFYKPIILMIHAFSLSQSCGLVSMGAFSTTIIREIMGPDVRAEMWMIIFDTERILSSALAVFVIHKFKRRTMMFSAGAMSISSHVGILIYVTLRLNGIVVPGIWLPAILLGLQFFSMCVGVTPMPSVLAGEVFPLEYRSLAGSISLVSLSGTMVLILKTFPGLITTVGIQGVYTMYTVMIGYCLTVMWFLMPETKGRTLQDIEDEFRGKPIVGLELTEMKSLKEEVVAVEVEERTEKS